MKNPFHHTHTRTHAHNDGRGRYATLPNIMRAKKKAIEETSAGALGVDASPRLAVLGHASPPARKPGVFVSSVAELVEKLQTEAKVL